MELSEFDKQNVGSILGGEGTWFSADLLRLIARADISNRERLRGAYPDHVAAFENWLHGGGDQ